MTGAFDPQKLIDLRGTWWSTTKAKIGAMHLASRLQPGVRYSPEDLVNLLAEVKVEPCHRAAAVKFLRTAWDYPLICRQSRHLTQYWIEPTVLDAEDYQERRAETIYTNLITTNHALTTINVSGAAKTGLTMAAIAVGSLIGKTAPEVMAEL